MLADQRSLHGFLWSRLLGGENATVSYSAIVNGLVLNRLLLWVPRIALVAIVVIGTSADASAGRRVALVVGNSNYEVTNISLVSPRNDAEIFPRS